MTASGDSTRKLAIQISDTHILPEGLLYDRVDTLANLRWTLEAIETSGAVPDVLLFTGDLTDGAAEHAYARFRSVVEPVVKRLGCAALYMSGNHDSRAAFRVGMLGQEPSDEPIGQVVWCDGLRVVAIDSTVPGKAYGALSDEQLEWLAAELATPAPLGTILALHHPPVPMQVPLLIDLSLREPARLGAVIAGTDVLLVVSGHLHCAGTGMLAGVPTWVAPASAYQTDLAGDWSSFRGLPGSAFTRIDVVDKVAIATQIPVTLGTSPLYSIGSEQLRAALAEHLD